MSNAAVRIVHDIHGEALCLRSALGVWLARGWRIVDSGAGVEQTKVSGEGPVVEAPPAPAAIEPIVTEAISARPDVLSEVADLPEQARVTGAAREN